MMIKKGHTVKISQRVICSLCLFGLWLGVGLQAHAQTDTVTYVYTDPQGTPLVKADASGNVIARYDYTPYGNSVTSLGAAPNGPGYTGHVNDPETGLVYMQARYFQPFGRFLSPDPLEPNPGNLFSFNRYAYGNSNPVSNMDPTGMQDCDNGCMKMRALSDHFSNMAAGVADADAVAGVSAEGGGDWARPGGRHIESDLNQKVAYSAASIVLGQAADSLSDIESFFKSESNGETPSIGSTIGVFSTFTPFGSETREASIAEKVIAETLSGKGNITSVFRLSGDQVLEAGLKFLGKDYTELDKGVYRSSDGLRQFRMDDGSLSGSHRPNVPHVHFELYAPGAKFPYVNNHVPFDN